MLGESVERYVVGALDVLRLEFSRRADIENPGFRMFAAKLDAGRVVPA